MAGNFLIKRRQLNRTPNRCQATFHAQMRKGKLIFQSAVSEKSNAEPPFSKMPQFNFAETSRASAKNHRQYPR
jgi:hypothetical protein